MLIAYALVFLGATAVGMRYFWNYIDAYEKSRPHTALNGYMEKLDAAYVADRSAELIAAVDENLQTEQQCRQVLLDALTESFSYVKKVAESDEDRHVYAIRCGDRVIGTMEMERAGESMMGFTCWQVTGDSFDLSYLLSQPMSITVPETFGVWALGKQLSSEYITQSNIPYSRLEELYDQYGLPYLVTYTAGPFLGTAELTATDPAGNPVSVDENTDYHDHLSNCDQQETASLDTAIAGFMQCYVDYMSNTGSNTYGNYTRLLGHMVSGSDLAQRMKNAMDGLSWVTDRGAEMTSLTVHHYIRLTDGRYLCDVTYVVDTRDYSGSIETTAGATLILIQTDAGLRIEAMKNGEI